VARKRCSSGDALSAAFGRIFGQNSMGKVSATAHRAQNPNKKERSLPDGNVETGVGTIDLVFKDDLGERSVKVVTTAMVGEVKNDTAFTFKGLHWPDLRPFGASFYGYIEGVPGKRIPVLVTFNMEKKLRIIDLEHGDIDRPLLESW
jgi:hypothetical protein